MSKVVLIPYIIPKFHSHIGSAAADRSGQL